MFDYGLTLKILDNIEVRVERRLAVIFLAGTRMTVNWKVYYIPASIHFHGI